MVLTVKSLVSIGLMMPGAVVVPWGERPRGHIQSLQFRTMSPARWPLQANTCHERDAS